ncbi:MAG TPA: Uma2 family endonuclease [Longimicrobiales bacterium]
MIHQGAAAGVREVWVVDPRARHVAVHRSPQSVRIYGEDEDLDGGEVVPGFGVRVGELFVD